MESETPAFDRGLVDSLACAALQFVWPTLAKAHKPVIRRIKWTNFENECIALKIPDRKRHYRSHRADQTLGLRSLRHEDGKFTGFGEHHITIAQHLAWHPIGSLVAGLSE